MSVSEFEVKFGGVFIGNRKEGLDWVQDDVRESKKGWERPRGKMLEELHKGGFGLGC